MMISVCPFKNNDAPLLAALMLEMTQFYGALVDPSRVIVDEIVRQSEIMDILVAWSGQEMVGFATFGSLFPVAGLISLTYVQQIYVAKNARRMGVAQRLMSGVAGVAVARGSTRVEWSTSKDNLAAQALYRGLGAVGSEKVQYVLEGDKLARLAALTY